MDKTFDYYFKWLGIPAEHQPPDYYRLLGIPHFTSDPDAIENAADQRMAHVRTFHGGAHRDASQTILNEISTARVTLLNKAKKHSYDADLKARHYASESSAKQEVPLAGPIQSRPSPRPAGKPPKRTSSNGSSSWIVWVLAGCGVGGVTLAVALLGGVFLFWRPTTETAYVYETSPETEAAAPVSFQERQSETPTDAVDEAPSQADVENTTRQSGPSNEGTTQNSVRPDGSEAASDTTNQQPDDTVVALADPPPATVTEVVKASVPAEADRKAADEKVLAVFGEDLKQASKADEKRALAQKMIQVAATTKQPPIQFALYQRAIDLAKEGGDVRLAFNAVDQLDAKFEGDAMRLKASVLHRVSSRLRRGDGHIALAPDFDMVIDAAVAENRFDVAQPLVEVALQSAVKAQNGDLRKRAVQRVTEIGRLAAAYEEAETALATLRTKPTDGEANLVAGKYYCFDRGDWSQGLPYLALANDDALAKLANEELKASPPAMGLGDGWWEIGTALEEPQSTHVKQRAAYHYRRALPSLSGFAKATVEKRISDLPVIEPQAPAVSGKVVDLIAISDPARHGEKGRWRKVNGMLAVSNLEDASFLSPPYQPPREYDLQVTVSRAHNGPRSASDTHVRIPYGTDCHTFGIRAHDDGSTSLSFWGDKPFGKPPMGVTIDSGFQLGKQHTLLFQVRDSGLNVLLDGRALFHIEDYSMLRDSDEGIGVGSFQNQTVFHEILVKELAQQQSPRAAGPVDLIPLIDTRRDRVSGNFVVTNDVLVTPKYKSGMDRLLLPLAEIPEQYDIDLVVERKGTGGHGLNVGFVTQGVRGQVVMDGYAEPGWAIDYIDGVRGPQNSTFSRGKRFTLNQRVSAQIQVRKGSVTVLCDGDPVFTWRGRPEQLAVSRRFDVEQKGVMFLGSQSVFHIHKLTVTPVGE